MALKAPAPTLKDIADMCLQHLVENPEQLAEFMVQSGLDPVGLRAAIGTPGFSHGLIDYVVSNESLLVAVATANKLSPEAIMRSWAKLHQTEH